MKSTQTSFSDITKMLTGKFLTGKFWALLWPVKQTKTEHCETKILDLFQSLSNRSLVLNIESSERFSSPINFCQ